MPKTFTLEDVTLAVYGVVEDGAFDTYEDACFSMNLDAETTASVLKAIAEDFRS